MKATTEQKQANRRRMEKLGLRVERIPKADRASYIRGNLQVHMALEGRGKK